MPKDVKVTLRFYSGQDDDLITWLESLHVSYGKKGEAIKDVLRQGLGPTVSDKPAFTAANPDLEQAEQAKARRDKKPSINSDHW